MTFRFQKVTPDSRRKDLAPKCPDSQRDHSPDPALCAPWGSGFGFLILTHQHLFKNTPEKTTFLKYLSDQLPCKFNLKKLIRSNNNVSTSPLSLRSYFKKGLELICFWLHTSMTTAPSIYTTYFLNKARLSRGIFSPVFTVEYFSTTDVLLWPYVITNWNGQLLSYIKLRKISVFFRNERRCSTCCWIFTAVCS